MSVKRHCLQEIVKQIINAETMASFYSCTIYVSTRGKRQPGGNYKDMEHIYDCKFWSKQSEWAAGRCWQNVVASINSRFFSLSLSLYLSSDLVTFLPEGVVLGF